MTLNILYKNGTRLSRHIYWAGVDRDKLIYTPAYKVHAVIIEPVTVPLEVVDCFLITEEVK